jgi:hypothetical protein
MDLDLALTETLARYVAHEPQHQSLISTHREIAIARYALEQQANAYHRSVALLHGILEAQSSQPSPSNTQQQAAQLSSIFSLVQAIEHKSENLIESAQKVANLVGSAMNIDFDRMKLHSLILSLPHLLRDAISQITDDDSLTESAVNRLSSQLNDTLSALRFSASPTQQQPTGNPGITLEQYTELLSSVPSQP